MKDNAPKQQGDQQATHSSLYAALAAAQAEMGRALKDSNNPHFKSKYADLSSVMDACMPALTRHGIAVLQPAFDEGGERFVKTIFVHGETGETVECRVPLIVSKNDMQGYGSAVTYARRYGLMGMAGIAPEDDDGNAASKAPPRQETPMGGALRDAWRASVEDNLPEGATARQKAEAFAEAICEDFKDKGERALQNRWDKHKGIIDKLETSHADLHEKVVDAFENRMIAINERGGA